MPRDACTTQGSRNPHSLREELEQKDEDLMRSMGRCIELEVLLRDKKEELEVGKGVAAEYVDLMRR